MNAITIELCAEDRARLDAIIAGLQGQCSAAPVAAAATPATAPAVEVPAQTDFPVVPDQVPWDEAPADPAPVAKPVSLAEFQKAITIRCAESPEVKAAIRGLVQEYATSASAIPEEKRAEVLAKLAQI